MLKFKRGLIVGPSGIGEAHIREFIKYGINKIGIIRKHISKNNKNHAKFLKNKKIKIEYLSNFKKIKNFKPHIISLCTPHYFHKQHLNKISDNFIAPVIVEKPFIVVKNLRLEKLKKISENLFKKFKYKIQVNLPMVNISNQLKSKIKKKKIKKIKFYYFTKGRHKYEEIAIDLIPHSISFVLSAINQKLKRFKIIKKIIEKNYIKIYLYINGIECFFYFKQNPNLKSSSLHFEIDKQKYRRIILKNKNSEDDVYFKINNKKHKIKNPMTISIQKSLNLLNRSHYDKINKSIVDSITEITYMILKF